MTKHFFLSLGLVSALVLGGVFIASDKVFAESVMLAQGEVSGEPTEEEGGEVTGAPENQPSLEVGLENPINIDSIEELILRIVEVVLFILYPIAILAIIYAGFKFITAQGKPDEISDAKTIFFWAVVGTGLLIGANVILALVRDTIENIGAF